MSMLTHMGSRDIRNFTAGVMGLSVKHVFLPLLLLIPQTRLLLLLFLLLLLLVVGGGGGGVGVVRLRSWPSP